MRRSSAPIPLPLAVENGRKVQETHNSRHGGVSDDGALLLIARQLQAQTAVDHSQNDSDAADADVRVGDGCAAAVALECAVVQPAAEGLGEQDDEQDDADDGVGVGQVAAVDGEPDAHGEGDDVDDESDDLQRGVHPDQAGEAGDADEDAADGEEADEGEGGHHAVREEDCFLRCAAEGSAAAVLGEVGAA